MDTEIKGGKMSETEISLANIGRSISEAIALRGKIANLEEKKAETTRLITAQKAEIKKLEGLKIAVDTESKALENLDNEMMTAQSQLNSRLEKLKKAGYSLPLNDPQSFKGFLTL